MSTTARSATTAGRYVPETLIPALDELEAAWESLRDDATFQAELDELRKTYAGRPTPITLAARFAPDQRVYLKREDLMHTGAHKLNNALGQVLIAQRLGKRRIIAETGAGQHGVATATVCAKLRARVHRLHGQRGHPPPGTERRADGAPRRRGAPGRLRHAHAQGSDERGDSRLDRERRDDALRDRLVRRSRPVPGARARAAARDRPRGARAVPRRRGSTSRSRDRVRRRRLERDRHVLRLHRGRRRAPDRRRGGRRRVARLRSRRRAARRALVAAGRRGRADHGRALDLGRARLPRRRPGARVAARQRSRRVRRRAPTTRQSPRSTACARRKGSSPRSSRRMRSRARSTAARELVLVCLSGRGDKDLAEVLRREHA